MLSTNLFNYHKPDHTLSAEASSLEPHGYNGAEIIYITSSHTGKVVRFEFSRTLITDDEDREVYGWEYKVAKFEKDVPANMRVVIYND